MVDRQLLEPVGMGVTRPRESPPMPTHSYLAIARRQHGLVTRGQLLSEVTRRQLDRFVLRGHLEVVRRGIYGVAGSPDTWERQLLAACFAAGPSAYASFRAAAAIWDLELFERDLLELTVPPSRRARIPGATVHQSGVWGPGHVDTKVGIPVTSVARTLCDLTAVVANWMVERTIDEALRRKLVTLPMLDRVAAALAGPGRRRCTVMSAALDARRDGIQAGESAPEARLARLLVSGGLPKPIQQYSVRVGTRTLRIDLAYPSMMVAIEYDGWDFHSSRTAFDADRARANELELLGWTVLRFTSRSSDRSIVDTVRAALERASVG